MCKYETRTLVHALPVAHARAWLQRVRMRVTHTAALHSRVCDAHTSLKRGYMYAFVRECTRLAPLMATHCVISTSGRVTPRYKTNDKARQIPLRFESLKSSLVLPVSLGFSDCLSLFPIYHSHSRALSLSLFPSFSLHPAPVALSPFVPLLMCPPLVGRPVPPTFYCFDASAYRGYEYTYSHVACTSKPELVVVFFTRHSGIH